MRHAAFHHAHRRRRPRLTTRARRSRALRLPLRARQRALGRGGIRQRASSRRAIPAPRPRSVQPDHRDQRTASACPIPTRSRAGSAARCRCGLSGRRLRPGQRSVCRPTLVAGALDRRTSVAVLDGGIAAWRAAGLPLEAAVREPAPRSLAARVSPGAWLTSAEVDALRVRPGTLLVDARGAERFAGRNETIDPRRRTRARRPQPSFPRQSRQRRTLPARRRTAASLDYAARLAAAVRRRRHVRLRRDRVP